MPPESLQTREANQRSGSSAEYSLPEWRIMVRRVWRESEQVPAHCRQQRQMIAAQREFLRDLDRKQNFTDCDGAGPEVTQGQSSLDEEIRA